MGTMFKERPRSLLHFIVLLAAIMLTIFAVTVTLDRRGLIPFPVTWIILSVGFGLFFAHRMSVSVRPERSVIARWLTGFTCGVLLSVAIFSFFYHQKAHKSGPDDHPERLTATEFSKAYPSFTPREKVGQ